MDVQEVESEANMSEEEPSNEDNNSSSKNVCVKLTDPSAESLTEVCVWPVVVGFQETMAAGDVAEDTENTTQKEKLPPGKEVKEAAGKGTTAIVKPVSVPPTVIITGTTGAGKSIKVLKRYRIILLGQTGAGKSSLANTIFEEDAFKTNHPISGERECQTESRSVHGRRITVTDTPAFFDSNRSEEEMNHDIVRFITECTPGPHAFLIVFKVKRFTKQEQAVITKIKDYFSEEALKYAVIVFTHGDQLSEGMRIDEFVIQNKDLSDLVKKCGGRCHVVDNENWKNKPQDEYRSNKFQVAELLNTIDKMVVENKGGWYTKKREPKKEGNKTSIRYLPQGDASSETNSVWISLTGPAAESFVKAVFGPPAVVMQETGAAASGAEKETEEKASTEEDKKAAKETEAKASTEEAGLAAGGLAAAGLAAAEAGLAAGAAAAAEAAAAAGVGPTAAAAAAAAGVGPTAAAAAAGGMGFILAAAAAAAAAAAGGMRFILAAAAAAAAAGGMGFILAAAAAATEAGKGAAKDTEGKASTEAGKGAAKDTEGKASTEAGKGAAKDTEGKALYSLLLLSFCVRLPIAEILMQFLAILFMLLLSVVLLLLWM